MVGMGKRYNVTLKIFKNLRQILDFFAPKNETLHFHLFVQNSEKISNFNQPNYY
jgi:hypothetical protein